MGTSEIELCSLLIVLAGTNCFWRFLKNIGTFLDHLGGVDTPMGGVPVLKYWAKLSKCMGQREVNISASIRTLSTKFCLEVPQTHRNISDYLGCVDKPMDRAPAPKIQAMLSKYIWEREVNISASIRTPCTKYFLEVPQTHKNISRSCGRC